MPSISRQIVSLEKVIKSLKLSEKNNKSKKKSRKNIKITAGMKKDELKKCTVQQLMEYIKKNKIDISDLKKTLKKDLVEIVWESLDSSDSSDSSDSDSSESDSSDSDSSDSDSD
jgi:coproporphyrinogen III oxidase-like Fe-S oxidoreductase